MRYHSYKTMREKTPKLYTFTIRLAVESYDVEDAFACVIEELQHNPASVLDDVVYDVTEPGPNFDPFYMDKLGLNEDSEVIWTLETAED
tara:strand:- start:1374 stop:1640 length:267 start_codon:yes stop_codon:yes gene_type:complete